MNNQPQPTSAKSPFYKKWWFWVIVVVVLVAIGGGASSRDGEKVGTIDGSSSPNNSDGGNNATPQKTEYAIGDIIKVDNQEIAVLSIEQPFTEYDEVFSPKDGKSYVKVNVQITNNSESTESYNILSWKIEDGDGAIDDYSDALFAQADDALKSGELASGGKKTGSIVFSIPEGDTNLKLHYTPNIISSKDIVIRLY